MVVVAVVHYVTVQAAGLKNKEVVRFAAGLASGL